MTSQVPGVLADHPKHAQLPPRPVDPCVLSGHLDHKPWPDLLSDGGLMRWMFCNRCDHLLIDCICTQADRSRKASMTDTTAHATTVAHLFRGKPSACVGCERLSEGMDERYLNEPCDGFRWAWEVEGRMDTTGTMHRGFHESGTVLGMGHFAALENLFSWYDFPLDGLDTDEEFTVTLRRIWDDED